MKYTINRDSRSQYEQGFILVLVIAISFVLSTLTVSILSVTSSKYAKTKIDIDTTAATYSAEAGLTDAVGRLNSGLNGSIANKLFYSTADRGIARYTVTIQDNGDSTLTLTSTGSLWRHATDTSPHLVRSLRALVGKDSGGSSGSALPYSVYAGSGGLNIVGGPVFPLKSIYVGGKLTVTNTTMGGISASNSGPASPPLNVDVANAGCEDSSGNSQLCMDGSAAVNTSFGTVYGNVCANGGAASGGTGGVKPGNGQGLKPGCTVPILPMPTFNKSSVTNSITQTQAGNLGSCNPSNWPANTKFTSDVSVYAGPFSASCQITLNGNIYIPGDLIATKANFNVSNSAGKTPPIIVVNGTVSLLNVNVVKNNENTGIIIVSFDSSSPACSQDPACVSLPTAEDVTSSKMRASVRATSSDLDGSALWAYFGGLLTVGTKLSIAYGHQVAMSGGSISPLPTGSALDNMTSSSTSYRIIDYLPVYD
ncbi:MAG: hypothetical protein WAS27_00535 [Candidatus Saccharimonadales bacterium]